MKKVLIKFLFFTILVLTLQSCATMFNGGSQSIMVRSSDNKEGIEVEITTPSGAYPTKLPATVAAEPSHEGVKIKVIDKCYDNTEIEVKKGVTPSYWANILNIWGFLIDIVTAKLYKYDNNVAVPVNMKEECITAG